MSRKKRRRTTLKCMTGLFLAAVMILAVSAVWVTSVAKADAPVEIWTYEDLLKLKEDPSGSYVLMADIDLKGKDWTPVDFTGIFDGGGHALLNAEIHSPGTKTFSTFDGNMVEYETQFSGFFSSLVNAQVQNLKLLGQEVVIDSEVPVFAGSIAGYMENSSISNCEIYGEVTIQTSGKSFGTGGIAGFGNGSIENTSAAVTLVCIDKNVEDKDEQFMGGAYASGYIDLSGNSIRIDGYDSDHGYVHDGGLVGMYILYPEDTGYAGYILGNTVDGMITFFEDNEDRRAYCEAYIGEIMNWNFAYDDAFDAGHFVRNEIFEFDKDLLPHICEDPQMTDTVHPATETGNGYTESVCSTCGYTRLAEFTPVSGNAELVAEHLGTQEGETEALPAEAETAPAKAAEQKSSGGISPLVIVIIILVVLIIIIFIIWAMVRKKQKQKEALRRARRRRQVHASGANRNERNRSRKR